MLKNYGILAVNKKIEWIKRAENNGSDGRWMLLNSVTKHNFENKLR
jgi:hypothetical protein